LNFVELFFDLGEEFFMSEIPCSHYNDILSNIVFLFILHDHIPSDILDIVNATQNRQAHNMIPVGCVTL
jgi:hypothetical protein